MKRIEIKPNDQSVCGKKVRRSEWSDNTYFEILYVGNRNFFVRDHGGYDGLCEIARDWYEYEEPKKTKRVAPAIVQAHEESPPHITDSLFVSEEEAKDLVPNLISWPAKIVIDGKAHEMWFEVEE